MLSPVGLSVGFPVRSAFVPTVQFQERNYTVSGITQNIQGVALGGVVVRLFNAGTFVQEQVQTSSTVGAYSFAVDKTQTYFLVAYKVGPPDVYGTTAEPLTPL